LAQDWGPYFSFWPDSDLPQCPLSRRYRWNSGHDVLRLTLLAPDIIEMILDGRQQPGLQFEQLRKSFPLEWQKQRDALR
jgi:hypothetical protein